VTTRSASEGKIKRNRERAGDDDDPDSFKRGFKMALKYIALIINYKICKSIVMFVRSLESTLISSKASNKCVFSALLMFAPEKNYRSSDKLV